MASGDPRPNVILLMTDQHRGDCLGCDGHPVVETPYLDELAAQGARFPHGYSAVPSCIPARNCLYTGMSQWANGHLGAAQGGEHEYPATIASCFTAAGYQTRAVGKIHQHPQRKHAGFEHMVLDESSRRDGGFVSDYHQYFEEHRTGPYGYRDHSVGWNSWMCRPSHLPEHLHPTWWTSFEGRRFLNDRDPTRPFFLMLSFARPHSPYDPPAAYFEQYAGRDDLPRATVGDWADIYDPPANPAKTDAWRAERSPVEIQRARAGYYGSITFIDHQIGLFLYDLQRHGLDQNTTLLFCADHGDMLGDHHLWRKTYGYEGSARVPFLLRPAPSLGLPGGQVLDPVVELRDVMPTLLESAGLPIPESVDGRSLLPLLRGETAGWRDYLHGEHSACYSPQQENHYVTDGHEKLIWLPRNGNRIQFFNLDDDPLETHDLSQDPAAADRVDLWTSRLIAELEPRGLGQTDGQRLLAPTGPPVHFAPHHVQYVVDR